MNTQANTETKAREPRADLKTRYEEYLRRHRGVGERTVYHSWRFADRFLTFRFGDAAPDFGDITPTDVVTFLQRLTTRKAPYRDKTPPTHLRNFFQYLFREGLTATNFALVIPSVAARRYDARLPRYLLPEQVEAVIAASRNDRRRGRRNYAMVLMLARFGLRAAEVIAVQLDDIDWRTSEIVIRGKGQRHDRLPLTAEVGEALVEYICHERISDQRALFVSARSPHRPFKDGQILNEILAQAFIASGVPKPLPYVGSHVLRHSLATKLIRNGASLDEVSDMLRHRSRATTMIYAKLDIEGLRSVAQPWPIAGGAQ